MMPDDYVSPMVRDCAMAIAKARGVDPEQIVSAEQPYPLRGFWVYPDERAQAKAWHMFVRDVEAVITALRTPATHMMTEALPQGHQTGWLKLWDAMLASALNRKARP